MEILLCGIKILIDREDMDFILQYHWYPLWSRNKERVYFTTKKNRKSFFLHRLIIGAIGKINVDHINGDTRDNRKVNLRLCTASQNNMNMKTPKRNTSGYRGVSWHKSFKKWAAYITINYKLKYLGAFDNKEAAALAYNEAAVKYHGKFASLNKVGEAS